MAPFGLETKVEGVIVVPGQTVIGLNGPTLATGWTIIEVVSGIPAHPLAVGVKM